MTKTIPLADAKKNLSSIVKDVEEKYDRFTVTRNGVDKAVILSSEEFQGLVETLDVLSSREEREAVARAKEQVKRHETISLEALKQKHRLK
ncbi:MAG: type II toxin-antitoxin system Phd/YefM family antitoxin [Syntrophorhabdales bacterium]|jgi:prevent-host-death family protein